MRAIFAGAAVAGATYFVVQRDLWRASQSVVDSAEDLVADVGAQVRGQPLPSRTRSAEARALREEEQSVSWNLRRAWNDAALALHAQTFGRQQDPQQAVTIATARRSALHALDVLQGGAVTTAKELVRGSSGP